jgi:hypothetical protein
MSRELDGGHLRVGHRDPFLIVRTLPPAESVDEELVEREGIEPSIPAL